MITKIQKWGNSYGVRISKVLADEHGISLNREMEILFKKGSLILKPKKQEEYTLKELLNGITKDNTPDKEDIEWFTNMKPTGKEIGIW